MDSSQLSKEALDLLMKEHASLRDEIKERLKTAFSHFAYAGAIVAFAFPLAANIPAPFKWWGALLAAAVGFAALFWIAILNMRWVQHAGAYIRWIEHRISRHFGEQVLGWEHYGELVRTRHFLQIPSAPSRALPANVLPTHKP